MHARALGRKLTQTQISERAVIMLRNPRGSASRKLWIRAELRVGGVSFLQFQKRATGYQQGWAVLVTFGALQHHLHLELKQVVQPEPLHLCTAI